MDLIAGIIMGITLGITIINTVILVRYIFTDKK